MTHADDHNEREMDIGMNSDNVNKYECVDGASRSQDQINMHSTDQN